MTGLMIREDLTSGSPCVNLAMTPRDGLYATARLERDAFHWPLFHAGPSYTAEARTLLRLQRVGNEVSGSTRSMGT